MKRKESPFVQSSSPSSESPLQFVHITSKKNSNSGKACASVQSNSSTEQVSSASAGQNRFGKIQFGATPPPGSKPFGRPPSGTSPFPPPPHLQVQTHLDVFLLLPTFMDIG
jgi:hypothetical protein